MTNPMSDARLAEIETVEAAAAKGPWLHDPGSYFVLGPEEDGLPSLMIAIDVGDPADAAFIAMARDAVPELANEVRRLQALLADGEPDVPGVSRVRILPTANGAWRARYRLNGKRRSSPVCETREKAVAHVAQQRTRYGGAADAASDTTHTELTVQGDEAP
jgi:hypothetical protein